jgi:hypothetical protein
MATRKKTKGSKPARKGRKKGMSLPMKLIIAFLLLTLLSVSAAYLILKWKRNQNPAIKEMALIPGHEVEESEASARQTQEEGVKTAESDQKEKAGNKKENSMSDPALQGTWVSTTNGSMLTIAGESFALDFPSIEVKKPAKGILKTGKGSFTVVDTQSEQGCGEQEGVYLYSIKGDELTTIRKKDPCKKRASSMDATWFRL